MSLRRSLSGVNIRVLNRRTELPPVYRNFGYIETGSEELRG
jgi:hypothetical protein